jgi:type IV secretory pathway TrbF-like protein
MHSTYYAIAAGLILAIALIGGRTWWLRSITFAQGYDAGYADAAKGYGHTISDLREHVSALQQDLASQTRSRRSQADIHQRALDTVMQDADARTATYARRANPFTEEDQTQLLAIAGKLALAADTFAGLTVGDHAQAAKRLSAHADQMARRLSEALLAAEVAVVVKEAA